MLDNYKYSVNLVDSKVYAVHHVISVYCNCVVGWYSGWTAIVGYCVLLSALW